MKKNFTAILIVVTLLISVAGLITGIANHNLLVSYKDTRSSTELQASSTTNNTVGETTTEPKSETNSPESTTLSAETKSILIKEASELLNKSTTTVLAEVDSFSRRNVSGKFVYNKDSGMYYLIRFSNEPDDPYSDTVGIIDAYTLKSKDDYIIYNDTVFLNTCNTILYWPIGGSVVFDLYDSAVMADKEIKWPLNSDQLDYLFEEWSR